MSEPTPAELQSEALRIQRVLEAVLDRHAGKDEALREDAVAEALGIEIDRLARPLRPAVVAYLERLYPEPPVASGDAAALVARCRALEEEIAGLRHQQHVAAARTPAPESPSSPPPVPALSSSDFTREIATVLLGRGRDVDGFLREREAPERMRAVVERLLGFAEDLGRVFLGATIDPERTMAGQLHSMVVDELLSPETHALDRQLRELQVMIGEQLRAFQSACEIGVQDLLKRITPAAVESAVGRDANWMTRSSPLFYRECWQSYEKRFDDLQSSDNIYLHYFDGAYRSELLRLKTEAQQRKANR